jgi:hypothetical protein
MDPFWQGVLVGGVGVFAVAFVMVGNLRRAYRYRDRRLAEFMERKAGRVEDLEFPDSESESCAIGIAASLRKSAVLVRGEG